MTFLPATFFQDLHRNDDIPASRNMESSSPLAAIIDGFRTAIARYRYRRTVVCLSRFSPHLLRDVGFDPEAVYGAADGDWRGIDAHGRRG